jgi:murein DD-endopeptidase MepM/ murein hydrolase activator NlpD
MELLQPIKGIGKHPKFRISQWFAQNLVNYSQFGLKGHNGLDYACPRGTPIHAVHNGYIVEATEKTSGFGVRVTQYFKDGNQDYLVVYGHCLRTAYPDMSYNFSNRSIPVKRGEVVALVDNTGMSTGDHLHLGLYSMLPNGNKKEPNNGYGGAIDSKPFIVWDNSEPEGTDMIKRKRVGGTEYLEIGIGDGAFSIGIASSAFAKELTDAHIPIEDASSVAPQKFTLSSDSFVVHKK